MIWRIEHFEQIDSTNSWLVSRAKEDAPEGLVAYSDFQSHGRGRLDRRWDAPSGSSLLCSVLLRPRVAIDDAALVVACVALAARAALVRLSGVRPDIKWPNDLVVGGSKVAGLLAEIVDTTQDVSIVVGIGVNLTYGGPGNVDATSILEQSGVTIYPRALLDIMLEELEIRRHRLDSSDGRMLLRTEYEGALVTLGQWVRIERRDDVLSGVAVGVSPLGELIVEVDGVTTALNTGDVIHLRSLEGGAE